MLVMRNTPSNPTRGLGNEHKRLHSANVDRKKIQI